MWEAFGAAIKVFFEKYLISTVFSMVLGTVIFLVTPKDCWVLVELTKTWFWLFICGCIFLIIRLIIYFYDKWQSFKLTTYIKNENKKSKECEILEYIKKLWDYVDGLCSEDREYLKQFLNSENKPITIKGTIFYDYTRLFGSDHIRKQVDWYRNVCYTKYVLEENFYNLLTYSAKKYQKIGRFEEV